MDYIEELMRPEVQSFIRQQESLDERELILRNKTVLGIPAAVVASQIGGRRRIKKKIPLYWKTDGIVYPPTVNLEQSSGSLTAKYKASILSEIGSPATNAVDLTGGFGVDTYYLSRVFRTITYVEQNEQLGKIARHNHEVLGADNIRYRYIKAEDFLAEDTRAYDLLFIDPSRRDQNNRRIFRLRDGTPDVTALLDSLLDRAPWVMIKCAPLLDIHQGIVDLKKVRIVFVLAVANECKEIIFLCSRDHDVEPEIRAVDMDDRSERTFSFFPSEEKKLSVNFSEPLSYIYEPNAAILKAGAFKTVASRYPLHKIQRHTHLYTSHELIEGFPGRIFKNLGEVKRDKETLSTVFPDGKANVLVRNFPLTTDQVKEKLNLQDGGERYLIATTTSKGKTFLAASRLYR